VPLLLTFEVNPDLVFIMREGYHILDLFSDVGGLMGILMAILGVLVSALDYNYFDNYLVSKLFKLEGKSSVQP
jgi:hypothetical protein